MGVVSQEEVNRREEDACTLKVVGWRGAAYAREVVPGPPWGAEGTVGRLGGVASDVADTPSPSLSWREVGGHGGRRGSPGTRGEGGENPSLSRAAVHDWGRGHGAHRRGSVTRRSRLSPGGRSGREVVWREAALGGRFR